MKIIVLLFISNIALASDLNTFDCSHSELLTATEQVALCGTNKLTGSSFKKDQKILNKRLARAENKLNKLNRKQICRLIPKGSEFPGDTGLCSPSNLPKNLTKKERDDLVWAWANS